MIVVIMGVSGAGKTTVGMALANQLGIPFLDADDFHSPASLEKMRLGIPLSDDDRAPWLHRLTDLIDEIGNSGVIACSALKKQYRDILNSSSESLHWVHLAGRPEMIRARLAERTGHYFDPALLDSQFEALEVPDNVLSIETDKSVDEIVDEIIDGLA